MAQNTANLHWCREEEVDPILRGGGTLVSPLSVRQGKHVQMYGQAKDGTYNPVEFQIRREAFFLKKLWMKVGGHWHPPQPRQTVERAQGQWFAKQAWETGSDDITRQAHFFFRDSSKNASGTLTVMEADFWMRKKGIKANGKVSAPVTGIAEMGVGADAEAASVVYGSGATKDPEVRFTLMYPGGDGEADLTGHVVRLLERMGYRFASRANYEEEVDRITDGYVSSRRQSWEPRFENQESVFVATVSEETEIEFEVSLDGLLDSLGRDSIRTAFAIRAVDVSDESNFVISDVVEVESDFDGILRIRG
jgi:hypothetical protein